MFKMPIPKSRFKPWQRKTSAVLETYTQSDDARVQIPNRAEVDWATTKTKEYNNDNNNNKNKNNNSQLSI